MNRLMMKFALAAVLVLPALAMAGGIKNYVGNKDTDSYKFSIDDLAPAYNASILANWSDMALTGGTAPINNTDFSVTWTLTEKGVNDPIYSGVLGLDSLAPGQTLLTFAGLTAGKYTLKLDGSWGDMPNQEKGLTRVRGQVNLIDDDLGGANNSFRVTAVPEPETYAMLLAGLGLMSTIARRRRRKS